MTSDVVNLAGAYAERQRSRRLPVLRRVYRLVTNDGPGAPGTFAGLPEGATVIAAGRQLRISYVGGDGNDVTLTVLNGAPTITDVGESDDRRGRARPVRSPFTIGDFETAADSLTVSASSSDQLLVPNAQHRRRRRRREPHGDRDTGGQRERWTGHHHAHGE